MGDAHIRGAAFAFLREQVALHGDVLPWKLLLQGCTVDGQRVPFVSPQGIFTPQCMELPLSIRTSSAGPYDDALGASGQLLYRYRGPDATHRDNIGLCKAMETSTPLVYLKSIVKGKYLVTWPVFVVNANPVDLTFTVSVDQAELLSDLLVGQVADGGYAGQSEYRQAYAWRMFRHRLHQRSFRERVLKAYREQCAICRLRHQELLDAAHIIPDTEDDGSPIVPNGLALCKLHHAAFDRHFVAVRDDYQIEVRADLLEERDGPMLIHGLQQVHGRKIALPTRVASRPDPELLRRRYQAFREAS